MTRLGLLLVLILSLSCQSAFAADRTIVAEGDYVSKQFPKRPAHWKLWHLRDGTYEVVETLVQGDVVQVFRFDSQFLPSGFSLTINPKMHLKTPPPQPPFPVYRTMISCRYGAQDLTCETEKNNKTSTTSIPVKQPYIFIPGDFYALDQLWLMTGVLRLTELNRSEATAVNVFKTDCTLEKAEKNLGALKTWSEDRICADRPIQLTYAGKQDAHVIGKTQPVTEYEVWVAGHEPGSWILSDLSVLQATSHGLVVSVRGKPDRGLGFSISNYKEYESWMPSQ